VRIRGHTITRPSFLVDRRRIILPAFGTYTGGLNSRDPALAKLMDEQVVAVLTGDAALPVTIP
jgi:metallophosphoesterase superfamily enzyme